MTLDLSKIPQDIIDKNIIPYTYTPQSPELLKDIKTYHYTLTQVLKCIIKCIANILMVKKEFIDK